jgi:hypothetical protein
MKISKPVQGYIYTEILTLPIAILGGYLNSMNHGSIWWLTTPTLIVVSTISYWWAVKLFNKLDRG